jgi:GNAT superfamily N-acetyltransferase
MSSDVPSGFSVELALPHELTLVQGILTERCKWLAQRRIEQWPVTGFKDEVIAEAIEDRTVYLVRVGKETAGTFAVKVQDALWADQGDDAHYLRRMATHRSWDGRGVGAAMVEWAADDAIRNRKGFLRLACVIGDDRALPLYYEGLGFEQVGERSGEFPTVALMQRAL